MEVVRVAQVPMAFRRRALLRLPVAGEVPFRQPAIKAVMERWVQREGVVAVA